MERVSGELNNVVGALAADTEQQRKAQRAAVVAVKWKNAIIKVYKMHAQLVLSHINAIYILQEEGAKKLIVYSDDSSIRADIDTMQEFLKMALWEQGERIDYFSVRAARGDMRKRHIYTEETSIELLDLQKKEIQRAVRSVRLSQREQSDIAKTMEKIDDISVRNALEKAMTAHLKSKHIK